MIAIGGALTVAVDVQAVLLAERSDILEQTATVEGDIARLHDNSADLFAGETLRMVKQRLKDDFGSGGERHLWLRVKC